MSSVSIKIGIVILIAGFYAMKLPAQEFNSSQYYSNLGVSNPSFTGIDDFVDAKLSVYQGWNSFNISNNNFYASVFTSLSNSQQTTIKNNALRLSSTAYSQIESQKDLRRKHGMGGMITNRNVGPYRSFSLNYQYAFHLPLSNTFNLSFGTSIGYRNQRINFSGFTVRDEVNDVFYQQLLAVNNASQGSYVVDFGLLLYSKRFYLGISSSDMITGKLFGDTNLNFSNIRRLNAQTAASFRLGPYLTLNTGAAIHMKERYELGWDANVRLRYKELIYVGIAYNNQSKLSALLGLSFNTKINFHYSFDQYNSSQSNFNVTAHELVLGFNISNRANSQPKFW